MMGRIRILKMGQDLADLGARNGWHARKSA
jgi:hypothetical protein